MWAPLASASVVFLLLYLVVLVVLTVWLSTNRIKIRSRWAILYLHVLCRLAAQACGLTFGLIGYGGENNFSVLIAMYILGAEGYFTLVLCTARYLVSWQNHHFGDSWLERKDAYPKQMPWYKKLAHSMSFRGIKRHPMTWVHWCLIAANAVIISGGSLSAGAYSDSSLTVTEQMSQLQTSRDMRTAGQVIFLAINCILIGCIIATVHQARSRTGKWFGHATLLLLVLTWPFLATRGIFGILQAQVPAYNFFNPENYDRDNLVAQFVIEEACLATMTEWVSCTLLTLTYVTSRNDARQADDMPPETSGEDDKGPFV